MMNANDAEKIGCIIKCNSHLSNDAQKTLLHKAAKNGNVEMIKHLINTGSDVNAQDILGKTPLMYAIENKSSRSLKMIEILYEADADMYIANNSGKNAVDLVINEFDYRCESVQKFFLDIIYQECMNDSEITAKRLIQSHYPLCQAVLLRNAQVVEYMIIHGCPVNSCDPDEQLTALGKAVELMDLNIITVLIKHDADVDLSDYNNHHPIFHYGTYTPVNIQQPEIIKILLQESILLKDVHQECIGYQFKSAFEHGNKEVIEMLLEHHSDILNMTDSVKQTPLHYLSGNPHSDVTELLRRRTIDLNVRDRAGRTPLYMATKYSSTHINTFKFLLENGANVNAKTVGALYFDVPLFSLCQNPSITKDTYFEIIQIFLQYDLDVQYVALRNQKTVFDVIIENQKFYMVKPLIAHLVLSSEQNKPINECIRHKIMSNYLFRKYFNICKAELVEMKYIIINTRLTLYKIIVDQISEGDILRSCRFSLDVLSSLYDLKKKFHRNDYYGAIVIKRISPIILKLELLQGAAPAICKLLKFGNNPHHLIICEILDYLDTQSLQTLIQIRL